MNIVTKNVLKGIGLTIASAIFAVFGIVVAATQNLLAGTLVVVGSSLFWGYACLLSRIVDIRMKRKAS